MNTRSPKSKSLRQTTRRDFLRAAAGAAAATTLAAAAGHVHAAENNTIKIALIGCGGRGTGAAAQAMATKGPTKLWAMADVFENRLEPSLGALSQQCQKQVEVPKGRQFIGMDAYRSAIDALEPGSLVILATPPAFRPIHLEYAAAKGMHVFMEKSFAVDAPGVRRVLKAGKEAEKKNLKIAGGLMSRHNAALSQIIEQIHSGVIGEVITCWAYREHEPVGFTPKAPGMSELAHQIRNYSNFTWTNGSFLLDWLIHNLDVSCWVKDAWPVSAQGQGGRQVRIQPDQLFDHYAVEYSFADGTRLVAQGRHIADCWPCWGCHVHGAKGFAVLGEGIARPRLYKGYRQTPADLLWDYKGPACNPYQYEHDLLFEAIRQDKPYNETDRCAKAAMTGILGRMAAESGRQIGWDEAMASNLELAPGLDRYTMESTPPVMPDAQGRYPIAMPGTTKVL
jgi:myo-inositol 2-dehydrogenase / D-chiro-inositol 1-dehydrogenase